jgi:hypothetical protein
MSGDSRDDDEGGERVFDPSDEGVETMKSLLAGVQSVAREDERAIEAFPAHEIPTVSDELRERIVQRILSAQQGATPISSAAEAPAKRTALSSRRRLLIGTTGLVAAAAVVAIWLRSASERPPLPGYTVSAEGGVTDVRGDDSGPRVGDPTTTRVHRMRPFSELVVTVRPDTDASGAIVARSFVTQAADVSEVHPAFRSSPSGTIQLSVRGADLAGRRLGPAVLRVVVGRRAAIERLEPSRLLGAPSGPDWRVLTVPLLIEAAPP